MTVCQPHRITNRQTMRKSSLLTAAKKARLKANPNAPRVRFAQEPVVVAGNGNQASSFSSCIPYLSNVLKVFLENGQTKTFKYDSNTCVQVRYFTCFFLFFFILVFFLRLRDNKVAVDLILIKASHHSPLIG